MTDPAPTSPDLADPNRLAVYIDAVDLRRMAAVVGWNEYELCRFVEAAIREKIERAKR